MANVMHNGKPISGVHSTHTRNYGSINNKIVKYSTPAMVLNDGKSAKLPVRSDNSTTTTSKNP